MTKQRNNQRLAYFSTGSTSASFTENDDGSISKRALILVEGDHKDNKGRGHSFDAEYIITVANNSTAKFEKGGHIPVLKDHVKTLDSEVGEVGSPFVAKVITEEDLPNPRNKHLVGKMGLFCDNMIIRASDVAERVKQGLHKTLSPGVDLLNKCINEISLTPTPAIQGLSMFSRPPLTFEEAEEANQEFDEVREEIQSLTDKFLNILHSITMVDEDQLEGMDKNGLKEKAMQDYIERIQSVVGIEKEPEEPEYDMPQYSLFDDNTDAEFAFKIGDWITKQAGGVGKSLNKAQRFGESALGAAKKGNWKGVGDRSKMYFLKKPKADGTGGGLNLKRAGLAAAGLGAAGYGTYRVGKAGLGMLGIGKKKEEPKRFTLFG